MNLKENLCLQLFITLLKKNNTSKLRMQYNTEMDNLASDSVFEKLRVLFIALILH